MPQPRYVYLNDQGQVFSSDDDPTPEDFAYAAVGMVTIIRVADFHCYGSEKRWLPISEGELGAAEIDDQEATPLHTTVSQTLPPLLKHRPSFSSRARGSTPTALNGELHAVSSASHV